jgi:hypothetical protein
MDLRRTLDAMGYCHFCNRPGRRYGIGNAAKHFGGRMSVVFCETCWRKVAPLVQPLHVISRYQRLIQTELKNAKTRYPNHRPKR